MKEGYIKQQDRKKILLIADSIEAPSGVGKVAREMVISTAHQLNWACIGGSISHPQVGKRVDFSDETNKKIGIEDSYVISYPTEGYGNPDLLRQLIEMERVDALLIVTDPRSYEWLFQMENEVRRKIPIMYLNIWDSGPCPYYNGPAYASCDLLMAISKQTKLFNKLSLENEGIEYIDLDIKG